MRVSMYVYICVCMYVCALLATYFESDAGNITDRVTTTTETRDQNLENSKATNTCEIKRKQTHLPPSLHTPHHTSSFSSMKFKLPSQGTKAVTFLPVYMKVEYEHI